MNQTTAPGSADSGSWYPVVRLLASVTLMTLAGSAMYGSIMALGPVTAEFGGGRAVGSLPYSLFMVGFGVGGIFMGGLADRHGILVPALIGSICLPAGLYLAANALALWQFVAALAILGGLLGASFSLAPLISDVSHWFSARRGLAVGIVASGTYVAGAVWPPILQSAIDSYGWRVAFTGLSVFAACTMLPLSLVLVRRAPVDSLHSQSGTAAPSSRAIGMSPLTLQCLICCAGFGCCVAMSMPQVHIVPLVTDLGHPAARGAEMLGLMLGFGVVSRLLSGWLSDHIGGLGTLLLGSALQALVLFAFIWMDSLPWLYAISVAFGLAQGGIVPSYAMIIRKFFPSRDAGWRIGTAMLFTILGMAAGAWMAGALYDLTGSYKISFINAILFNVMNLGIAFTLIRRAGRQDGHGTAMMAGAGAPAQVS